jgi:hypothetical protein
MSMFAKILGFIALTYPGFPYAQAVRSPFVCPITTIDRAESGGRYGNDALETTLWSRPVEYDGSPGVKWWWNRLVAGKLLIGGRRLDAQAPPLRAYISTYYGDIGFQPVLLAFPTVGCWEVTGSVAGKTLTFVVQVDRHGPDPRTSGDGVPRGYYVTDDGGPLLSRLVNSDRRHAHSQ